MNRLSGLIQTLIFIVIILLFIDGSAGWLLLYVIVAAVAASVLLAVLAKKRIKVSLDGFSGITSVGAKTSAVLTVSRRGFCLAPQVMVLGDMAGQPFTANASLLLRDSEHVDIFFRPAECGLKTVTINKIIVSDFFGIVRLKTSYTQESSVAVLPRFTEYRGPAVLPSLLPSESEQQEEGASTPFGGMAGYEHRDYTEGDSPRRINYKLSAKKQKLMVRLNESTGTQSTNVILSGNADGICAEQAFALAQRLVQNGSPVRLYYMGESFGVTAPESLDRLREWLAFRRLGSGLPDFEALPEHGVNVLISPEGIMVQNEV